MSLLETLSKQRCERETSRAGCSGPEDHWCNPCLARQELGRPREAPRFCACGVQVKRDGDGNFVGVDGSTSHPAPHVTAYFYDEYRIREPRT